MSAPQMGLEALAMGSARESYSNDGYVIAKQAFSADHLAALCHALFFVLDKSNHSDRVYPLDDLILKCESQDHALVYKASKSVGSSAASYQLLGSSRIFSVVSSITGFDLANLHLMPLNLVIQLPSDDRFDYDWHQDGSFHDWCSDLVVLWFPVNRPATRDTGTISVIPGSHRYGPREAKIYMKHGIFKQMQPSLRDDELAREKVLEMSLGDCCIMSGNIVHRSILNRSASPRVAGVLRAANLSTLQSYDVERFQGVRKA